ncbi:nucleolar pre-ribosomal-associated protein 1-like isoform X2 [Catharus ustulatus]|uniref:nucleolar pre-ribosomal-associated protein 1-like isoform X2 n=1 Tax=Catharus ustulatus TaxID=91951 RepID=UPI001408D9B7|nr:nucleolar pre-ribosomal-associated protein 1-like isoform X2 [Catharus ustulatus]
MTGMHRHQESLGSPRIRLGHAPDMFSRRRWLQARSPPCPSRSDPAPASPWPEPGGRELRGSGRCARRGGSYVPGPLWRQYVVEEVNPDDWCSLVKTGLEYSYSDETFLKVLNVAIPLLYKKESSLSQNLVKFSELHVMITQHSLFLSTILRSIEEDGTTIQTRGQKILLVFQLYEKNNPSLINSRFSLTCAQRQG